MTRTWQPDDTASTNRLALNALLALDLRLSQPFFSIEHERLDTIQYNPWIQSDVLHTKEDVYRITELPFPLTLGINLP